MVSFQPTVPIFLPRDDLLQRSHMPCEDAAAAAELGGQCHLNFPAPTLLRARC
jgi:hypothetical protein